MPLGQSYALTGRSNPSTRLSSINAQAPYLITAKQIEDATKYQNAQLDIANKNLANAQKELEATKDYYGAQTALQKDANELAESQAKTNTMLSGIGTGISGAMALDKLTGGKVAGALGKYVVTPAMSALGLGGATASEIGLVGAGTAFETATPALMEAIVADAAGMGAGAAGTTGLAGATAMAEVPTLVIPATEAAGATAGVGALGAAGATEATGALAAAPAADISAGIAASEAAGAEAAGAAGGTSSSLGSTALKLAPGLAGAYGIARHHDYTDWAEEHLGTSFQPVANVLGRAAEIGGLGWTLGGPVLGLAGAIGGGLYGIGESVYDAIQGDPTQYYNVRETAYTYNPETGSFTYPSGMLSGFSDIDWVKDSIGDEISQVNKFNTKYLDALFQAAPGVRDAVTASLANNYTEFGGSGPQWTISDNSTADREKDNVERDIRNAIRSYFYGALGGSGTIGDLGLNISEDSGLSGLYDAVKGYNLGGSNINEQKQALEFLNAYNDYTTNGTVYGGTTTTTASNSGGVSTGNANEENNQFSGIASLF
ncbi:hypothetical protein Dalk_4548 [Desulfatibacillum aliphaticivorans]|uniref:Uncharacterized protein n=1 Tax=Desulfatibacillum aliphaticivorans TaxID=218208 RepID=B8FCR3_DESAL|nr:hypothetical protein [Desulfatibacillum aliphaticivorans]ACL06226.1 hypothetical protein Dalk_4548 [Desulfatibacillum aliphaticivorans]